MATADGWSEKKKRKKKVAQETGVKIVQSGRWREDSKAHPRFSSSTIMAAVHTSVSSPLWTRTDVHSLLDKKKRD